MSLLARFTQTRMPPELKERLRATREAALTQLIRGVMLVALMALVAFSYNAIRNPQAGAIVAVISNSILFGVLVVLNFLRRLRYVIRAATFALLLYGVALVLLATTGIGSAGRLYLLAFAVITTIFFGMRIGLWAAVLSLATWAAFAIAFSFFLPAPVGPDSAVFTDWLSAFFGLLLLLVALIIPQRQFLETQTTAIITAFEKSALEEARAALQKKTEELEAASGEATLINQQLQTQAEVIQHRAAQLALSAEVARSVASLHDLPELLNTTVQLISERFDYYHAGIFLADDAREWAVLQAASSEGGQRMLAREHRLRIGRQGIVGYVMAAGQPRIAQDVGGDIVHYVNPDLPETRSEMALPISARGSVIGALDVQSTTANAFSDEDVRVLQSLADQLGVAIENARLFAATQRNIEELRALQREARRQGPTLGEAAPTGYRYDGVNVVVLLPGESGSQAPTPGTLHIPLNVGDEALGVIEIKRQGNEVWSPDDVELTEAIANRMTLALENARLYEQAQARAQQMTNLSEAALELTGPQFSLSQLLDLIGKRGLKLFNADYVGVWLPAGQNELELRAAQTATAILTPGRRLKRGEGLAGEVLASGRITRLDDYQTWSGRTEPGEVILRSVLGVPMTWQHDVLGVLVLSHTETERKFTNEDERSARLFATQAAAALENARLLQETQDRISELATINTVSQVATAQLDLTTLLDTIGEQIFHTFRVSTGYIALYNPDTNLIDFPYVLENGERLLNYPPMQFGDGLSSIILRSRQPMLVNRETERRLTTLGAQLTGAPAQSFLGVPIVVGETAIGLISLQSIEAEGLFDEADQRLLTTIAASVGAALQNARLFEQTQRRVAELGTINTISQTLASSQLDLRATLSLVGDRILQTFPEADGGYIALYNSRTNQIEIPYFRDADGSQVSVPPVALGRGLSSHIIQTRQPLLVNQDTVQRLQALGAIITGQPAQSYLGVPMIVGDEVVGVLSVQSLAREGLFNDGDVRLLVTIAANVGVALENARLFEQTQAALSENRTLFLISRTLAQVTTIAEILDTVVTYALPAGADRASLITFHATEQDEISELEVVGFRDLKDEYQRLGLRLPAAAAPFITRLGAEPVVIPDTHAAPDLDMFTRQTFQQFDIQATCLLPLRAGGKLIGLLTTSARQPTPFDAEAMPLLQATADQVAVTMEKLRLLAETQRRADQLATAAEVSRVANSVLDPDQLIVRVVELIRERFNLYYSALFLVDENGQWARLRHATGDAGRTLLERGHQLEVGGNSMIGQAVARREARIALDVGVGGSRQTEAARFVNPLLPDTRSEMALPLAVGPTVIGAVSVQSTQPNAFSPADITVLQTMVDQVAISLQNARLFTAAQRELAERTRAEALLAGQRRILELIAQSQALPHVLDALARFVEERSERALCSILLMDSNGQNLRRGAAPSLPPDFTDTVDGLLIGPRAGSCGTAAFLKQQVITTDIVNDPLWVDYRDWIVGTHGLRAAWSTPILSVNNQVLGTVALYHREVKAPTPRELELMGIATYLAGIAIARYQSQQALDYERYLLHTLLENVPDKIYFKDRESHFIRASRGVSTQFGLTQDEIVGKSDFDFFTAEHARQAYKDEQEMLSTGQNVIGKLERETWPDRPDTWVLTSKLVMRDVGGDVIGSFGISRDVTELKQAQDAAQRRAQLLAAAAEIGRAATASLDVETLLRTSVNLIRDRFGFYHASIFIIDSKTNMAVVRESTGEAGAALKARGHQLAVGSNSLVGRATATRQPVVVQDVTTDLNHFKNPLLPDTRAEAVLPLVSGDRVIGALDVQSASAHAFAVEDMAILATIADQLAVAIQNANLFDRTARTARREQLVGEITNKIRAASSIEAMLQTAVTELRQALGVSHGVVKLGPPAIEDKHEGNGHGSNGSKGNGASGV